LGGIKVEGIERSVISKIALGEIEIGSYRKLSLPNGRLSSFTANSHKVVANCVRIGMLKVAPNRIAFTCAMSNNPMP
jgi:hypothetical protein